LFKGVSSRRWNRKTWLCSYDMLGVGTSKESLDARDYV